MGRRRRRRKMRAQKAAQSKQVKAGVAKVKTAQVGFEKRIKQMTTKRAKSAQTNLMKKARSLTAKQMKGKGSMWGNIVGRARGGGSKFASRKKANTMRSKTGKYSEASRHAKHVQGRTSDNVKQHGASLKAKYAKNYQSEKLLKG